MTFRLSLLLGALMVMGAAEPPAKPIVLNPAEAAKEGRALISDILSQRPDQNVTNTGVLRIRQGKERTEVPMRFEMLVNPANWMTVYQTAANTNQNKGSRLEIVHAPGTANQYQLSINGEKAPHSDGTGVPFAGSDFWTSDLGLEFFYWPDQRLLKKEIRRGQSCNVVESINPKPTPGNYSRVVSWIDIDSNGIVHADAYDHRGKLLKIFEPNEFKKVRGQWQLQEMEIRNTQTGSRTQIEFDLTSR